MSVLYNWELNGAGSGASHRRVKKSGTVVLHSDDSVDTSFARLLKPHLTQRLHFSNNNNNNNNRTSTNGDTNSSRVGKEKLVDGESKTINTHEGSTGVAKKSARNTSTEVEGDAEVGQQDEHTERQTTAYRTPLMTATTAERLRSVNGFTELLPCQAQCYRGIFNGRDVILHSRTGSGKTLAYALPIIERHLLELAEAPHATESVQGAGPFMLILVFSSDLALQTRSVLTAIYPHLHIAVAGWEDEGVESAAVEAPSEYAANAQHHTKKTKKDRAIKRAKTETANDEHGKDKKITGKDDHAPVPEWSTKRAHVDILIGTVSELDKAIRGSRMGDKEHCHDDESSSDEDEVNKHETKDVSTARSGKRARSDSRVGKKSDSHTNGKKAKNNDNDNKDASANVKRDYDTNKTEHNDNDSTISVRHVRAVVIDEVDTTLGPHFSLLGRRVKSMLRFVRRANGSLTSGLLTDYRAHHYVLCGATIPNWVIRAGFLGVKKFYYALVAAGEAKLPVQLECRTMRVPRGMRVTRSAQLLCADDDNSRDDNCHTGNDGNANTRSESECTMKDTANSTPGDTAHVHRRGGCRRDATHLLGRVVVFGTERQLLALEQALRASGRTSPRCAVMLGSRNARERAAAVSRFNSGEANTLLCTDVAARGLDFVNVRTVLMLSLPHTNAHMISEMFVHRAGRTARVGRPGRCVVMVDDPAEMEQLEGIAKATHVRFHSFVEESMLLSAAPGHVLAENKERGGPATRSGSSHGTDNNISRDGYTDKHCKDNTSKLLHTPSVRVFELTVRNPFNFAAPAAGTVVRSMPTARAVLEAQMEPGVRARLSDVCEVNKNTEVVRFAVPAACEGEVRGALWKYSVKDVTPKGTGAKNR